MNTTNASSFFQSAETQEKFERQAAKSGNTLGDPITFSTKLLDVSNDLDDAECVLVAESGSIARRVNHVTGATVGVYRGHSAPVTKVLDLGRNRVATGSWDKTIRVFNKTTRECLAVLQGHTDFIKCLLYIDRFNLLLSGAADTHVRAWSLNAFDCTYTLKGHARGVETLTLGPGQKLYSGGSESSIRTWTIGAERGKEEGDPCWIHETSLYALKYDEESESLWSASADRTTRQLTWDERSTLHQESSFEHPDYVRDVVVHGNWLITACRDEDIRVWEIGSGKLAYTLQGHFSEVSSLCISGQTLISCSLDATLRRWTLTDEGLQRHVVEQKSWKPKVTTEENDANGMTSEELAELEELMADD